VGHPEIINPTRLAFMPLFMADEALAPLCVAVLKATYLIGADGSLALADLQRPVDLSGEHWGEPEVSSIRLEPEIAWEKLGTDVVLVGTAMPAKPPVRQMEVSLKVGRAEKRCRVVGDRVWYKGAAGHIGATEPLPFSEMPLVWERAFGGRDESHQDADKHSFEPRNPIGVGFRAKHGRFEEGVRLPNLEHPDKPLQRFGEPGTPFGFGFLSPHWQPRAALAGTYDEPWQKTRMPLLPLDFDRRFFNAAPADQIFSPGLRGDESFEVTGVGPRGRLRFSLPGLRPPHVNLRVRQGPRLQGALRLDTVIILADAAELLLLWRVPLVLPRGPTEVAEIAIEEADVAVGKG
jgi:hypothetical protein